MVSACGSCWAEDGTPHKTGCGVVCWCGADVNGIHKVGCTMTHPVCEACGAETGTPHKNGCGVDHTVVSLPAVIGDRQLWDLAAERDALARRVRELEAVLTEIACVGFWYPCDCGSDKEGHPVVWVGRSHPFSLARQALGLPDEELPKDPVTTVPRSARKGRPGRVRRRMRGGTTQALRLRSACRPRARAGGRERAAAAGGYVMWLFVLLVSAWLACGWFCTALFLAFISAPSCAVVCLGILVGGLMDWDKSWDKEAKW